MRRRGKEGGRQMGRLPALKRYSGTGGTWNFTAAHSVSVLAHSTEVELERTDPLWNRGSGGGVVIVVVVVVCVAS